jgi:hypothetical protein
MNVWSGYLYGIERKFGSAGWFSNREGPVVLPICFADFIVNTEEELSIRIGEANTLSEDYLPGVI